MISHKPWKGAEYELGIAGQRIAIMGYSHWLGQSSVDCDEFTCKVMSDIVKGGGHTFFACIRNYFGFASHDGFWQLVLFFNYAPCCVGNEKQRYRAIAKEDAARAETRFRDILTQYEPDKVFVFSTKGWDTLPVFDSGLNSAFNTAGLEKVLLFNSSGTYDAGGKLVMAFGLRHPQGAPKDLMRDAVKRILEVPRVHAANSSC